MQAQFTLLTLGGRTDSSPKRVGKPGGAVPYERLLTQNRKHTDSLYNCENFGAQVLTEALDQQAWWLGCEGTTVYLLRSHNADLVRTACTTTRFRCNIT